MTNASLDQGEYLHSLDADIADSGVRRIFCNRDLNLATVQWIGFDMDYTLAMYRRQSFDELTYELTLSRLIESFGYPESLREASYDADFAIRGLVIDRQYGNILKMNVFRHVGKGVHGFKALTDEERARYRKQPPQISSDRFRLIDTLFEMPEAYLFALLVDDADTRARQTNEAVDYAKIADDVRAAIDSIHADNTLKSRVVEDLPRYVYRDPDLAHALHKLRSAGKKLFLLTNSDHAYTEALMSWMLGGRLDPYTSWHSFFDVIITAACKPSFFRGDAPFLAVNEEGQVGLPERDGFHRGVVYANGNLRDFERYIGLGGDEVLYVGDHIFGDILRSKLDSNWRTAMIIPEMEDELDSVAMTQDVTLAWHHAQRRINGYQREMELRSDAIQRLRSLINDATSPEERARIDRLLRPLVRRVDHLRRLSRQLLERTFEYQDQFDGAYHERWGALFKEGNELSLFGSQIDHFACVYTSRASNLVAYSPLHYFRSPPHSLPHEDDIRR